VVDDNSEYSDKKSVQDIFHETSVHLTMGLGA